MEIHTRQPTTFQVGPSTSQAQQKREMPSSVQLRQQQHLLAVAVISRLHRWCVQLFWMTVLCVIGVVGDEKSTFSFEFLPHRYVQNGSSTGSGNGAVKLRKRHTLADIENKVGIFLLYLLTLSKLVYCYL
ncbi:hypothetical protein WR25_02241 [Diploscapter pachys]|uniref:Uncharacterized protein n=1 Tax=Diploscapter pachys TaxID=2018661 RepID=A0A2A2LF42_9BILA|nr:hypothetical protein WR25_02241 [Diploscapter pachys]